MPRRAAALKLKFKQVQTYFFAVCAPYGTVGYVDDHFAGGGDKRLVEVPAENFTLAVARAHVQVGVELPVLCRDRAEKGNNFVVASELIRLIRLCLWRKHTDREVVYRAYRRNRGELYALALADGFEGGDNFLSPVNPCYYFVAKFPIVHCCLIYKS